MSINIHSGIVRRVDDLGRIVIPKELRRELHIKENDPLEIALSTTSDGTRVVVLSRYITATQRMEKLCACALKSIYAPKDCAVSVVDTDGHFIAAELCTGTPAAKSTLFSLESRITAESDCFRQLREHSFETDNAKIALARFTVDGDDGYIVAYIPKDADIASAYSFLHSVKTATDFISQVNSSGI